MASRLLELRGLCQRIPGRRRHSEVGKSISECLLEKGRSRPHPEGSVVRRTRSQSSFRLRSDNLVARRTCWALYRLPRTMLLALRETESGRGGHCQGPPLPLSFSSMPHPGRSSPRKSHEFTIRILLPSANCLPARLSNETNCCIAKLLQNQPVRSWNLT